MMQERDEDSMAEAGTPPETELVALQFRRGKDLVDHLLHSWNEGRAVLPMDPALSGPAVRSLVASLRPSRVVTDLGESVVEGEAVAHETALVVTTSGSTGSPKGVELSHSALDWAARASSAFLGDGEARWLCCLPLHHIAGLMVVLRARLGGRLPVIHDGFDEEAVMQERAATHISLVPLMLRRLLDAGADLSRYSAILLGGGPIPGNLLERASEKGAKVVGTYGMTETCGGCIFDGLPLDGVEFKLDAGRILLRGPMLFNRYRLQRSLTEQAIRDGWFRTSDAGAISETGRLSVLGRLDDVIVTGGKKVSAAEVERILLDHPSVREAAVAGLPSDEWGQQVAAALVLDPDTNISLEEVRRFVSDRAPRWTAPKMILQVPSLPKSATGKVLRSEIAALFRRELRDVPRTG